MEGGSGSGWCPFACYGVCGVDSSVGCTWMLFVSILTVLLFDAAVISL